MFNIVLIETLNQCTRRCRFCKFGQARRDPAITRMPDYVLKKIADNLQDLDYRGRISPFGINEPLLDPRMPDIVRLFRAQCPDAFISLASNGDLLTGEIYQALMAAGLDGLGISVYEDSDWLRLEPYARYPKVQLLDFRQNDCWENRGGKVKRGKFIPLSNLPCLRPFHMLVIRPTGDVVLCCSDMYCDVVIGNVAHHRLEEIWLSEKFNYYRTKLDSKTARVGLKLCQTCSHDGSNCSATFPFPDKSMQTSFSIIMPTYNRRHCIKNAIDSLLTQTYQNYELIIIDDGSSDDTDKYLLDLYGKELKEGKIIIIKLDKHRGASFARNKGLEAANNEWIGYLDTDNRMHSDLLETFVENIKKNPSTEIFYAQIKHTSSGDVVGSEFNFDKLIISNFIDLGSLIHSKKIYKELGGFDTNLSRLIDWDIIIRYTEKYKPVFIEKVLLNYYDGSEHYRITLTELHDENYKKVILNYFKRIPASRFFSDRFYKYQEYATVIAGLNQNLAERDAQIAGLNQNLAERDAQIAELNQNLATLENDIVTSKVLLGNKEQIINSMLSSWSWIVTWPLRQIDAVIRKVRYLLVASAQHIYDATPFPPHIRKQVTNYVFTCFGTFFEGTDPYKHWLDRINAGVDADQSNLVTIETYYEKVPGSVDKISGLSFRNPEAPIVSIVIPVFNNWRYTYACLNAILERSGENIPYEVIIADDGSTDDTPIMLESIRGIQVLKNASNLGFVRNCNNAAKHARGKYVVFLNNDTEVQYDWLNPLVSLFERFSNVGMVGGRLLYADGKVQEAGGIILQNGWGHPYGRGGNPASYEFNYVREVDCLIGACIMVEKNLFLSLGGFDESFAPAFYEEFDLAFTLRKQGYKIMYQPASSILHFDCSSYGAELRDKQSTINHQKFCSKWRDELTQQTSVEDDLFLARDRSRSKKIILVIDERVPDYDQHAGGLTTYQYLRLFCDMGFKVIFLPDTLYQLAPYTTELQQLGIEVIYGDIDIKEWLTRYGKYLHYAWLTRPDIASKYIGLLKQTTSSKILYFTMDLHYLRELRRYELDHNQLHLVESQRLKKLEFELFSRSDVILTPSNYEELVIKENTSHKNVFTIPLHFYEFPPENDKPGVDFSQREGMLFLGGYVHMPNVDAVLWFVKEILPRVREQLPEVTFTVAGSHPSPEILALQNERLRVTGYVPDLRPLFETTRVFVAPLRYGAGVKGKIITSMVYGVPVVTTSIGNEGMDLVDGQEALIADGPEAFAARTVELYTNQALWERLANEAQTYVRHHFGTEKARQLIQTVMMSL